MNLLFEAIAYDGEYGYASDYSMNGLYKVNLNNYECEYLMKFDDNSSINCRIHCAAVQVKNKVFFIPAAGRAISVYDVVNNEMRIINIPSISKEKFRFYNPSYKFIDAVKYDNIIWLIPASFPGVVKLNTETETLNIFDNWVDSEGYLFRKSTYICDRTIYVADGKSNKVLVFDMNTQSGSIKRIGCQNKGTMTTCICNDTIWFAPKYIGAVVSWNIKNNQINEYTDFPYDFKKGRFAFTKNYNFGGDIFFVPNYANYGLVLKQGKLIKDEEHIWKTSENSFVEFLFETETNYFFREKISEIKTRYFCIVKDTNKITEIEFKITNEEKCGTERINYQIREKGYCNESLEISLLNYINTI